MTHMTYKTAATIVSCLKITQSMVIGKTRDMIANKWSKQV